MVGGKNLSRPVLLVENVEAISLTVAWSWSEDTNLRSGIKTSKKFVGFAYGRDCQLHIKEFCSNGFGMDCFTPQDQLRHQDLVYV